MHVAAVVLALLATGSPADEGLAPVRTPNLHLFVQLSDRSPGLAGFAVRQHGAPPPCADDVCQPRVAVPGYEPQFSIRGKRTELALRLLDRTRIEPLATVVRLMALSGIRLDYSPAQFDSGALESGRGGWGHFQVLLRWRIAADGTPVFPLIRG